MLPTRELELCSPEEHSPYLLSIYGYSKTIYFLLYAMSSTVIYLSRYMNNQSFTRNHLGTIKGSECSGKMIYNTI